MAKDNDVWNELIYFVMEKTAYNNIEKISRKTALNHDIDLEGDDADEFMEDYFQRFSVDPGDYDWARYFGEEGFNPIGVLLEIFKKQTLPKPLRLGMLEFAVKNQKWTTEILENL